MLKLLLATTNPGKIDEMRALLRDLALELLTPADLGLDLEVDESGRTYAENAALKGQAFAQASGLATLADDSGLEVDALGGLPGLRSHRLAPGLHGKPNSAADAARRAHLLRFLEGHPRPWSARFVCSVALALPSQEPRFAHGACPGEIIPEERGEGGFGYDPIFYIPELGRTMAELTMEEKNEYSHRARAVRAARPFLVELIDAGKR